MASHTVLMDTMAEHSLSVDGGTLINKMFVKVVQR